MSLYQSHLLVGEGYIMFLELCGTKVLTDSSFSLTQKSFVSLFM